MMKKKIVLLAAHEPSLDPRIDWIARFAAKSYHVVVVGLASPLRPMPTCEEYNGYKITRCKYTSGWNAEFLITMLKILVPSRLLRWPLIGAVSVIGIVLWPLAVLGEILLRFARCGLRLLTVRIAFAIAGQRWPSFYKSLRLRVVAQKMVHFIKSAKTFYIALHGESTPDVIHSNDLDTLLGAVILKQIHGCAVIYDAHEFYPYSDVSASWWEILILRKYEKCLLKYVDSAFTVNPLLAEAMEREYDVPFGSVPNCEPLSNNKILEGDMVAKSTSHSAVSRVTLLEGGAMAQSENGTARDRVRFLFQGNFAPERGIEELLRAWVQIDSDRAVLILRGQDNPSKTECIALAKELDLLDKSVVFAPPVIEADLITVAAQSDVGIIPYLPLWLNYRLACPNKLSQYMQAGLAILSNDLDFIREVITFYKCGLTYDSQNPKTIVESVQRIIEDESFRKRCQENARAGALADFHWEKQSEALYSAYARHVVRT